MLRVPDRSRRKVLFVVDQIYWVTATISRQIAACNLWIDAEIVPSWLIERAVSINGRYRTDADIVHFMTPHAATALMAEFRRHHPVVVAVHHIEDERSTAPVSEADAVMTVCREWHDALIAQGVPANKCVMVPNGVELDLFAPCDNSRKRVLRARFGLPGDGLCIGFSGKRTSNTYGRKGIETLVAAARLLGRSDDLSVAILGPGWDDLVDDLREQGIACVYHPFLVERSEVADFHRMLDFFWVTSRIEGGPVPLIEAMSTGVICISTPVGIAKESIVDGVNGFLVSFEDPQAYAKVVSRLAGDAVERGRISAAARKTAIEKFDVAGTKKAVGDLYAEAERAFCARGGVASPTPTRLLSREEIATRRWMRSEQHLQFADFLGGLGIGTRSMSEGLRAIAANPLDPGVWVRAASGYPTFRALAKRLHHHSFG